MEFEAKIKIPLTETVLLSDVVTIGYPMQKSVSSCLLTVKCLYDVYFSMNSGVKWVTVSTMQRLQWQIVSKAVNAKFLLDFFILVCHLMLI